MTYWRTRELLAERGTKRQEREEERTRGRGKENKYEERGKRAKARQSTITACERKEGRE